MCRVLLLCVGYESYVWDSSLMCAILVLCVGYYSYVRDTTLMCGILLLCVGYYRYVRDISLMCGILLLLDDNNNHNRSSPHSVRGINEPATHPSRLPAKGE